MFEQQLDYAHVASESFVVEGDPTVFILFVYEGWVLAHLLVDLREHGQAGGVVSESPWFTWLRGCFFVDEAHSFRGAKVEAPGFVVVLAFIGRHLRADDVDGVSAVGYTFDGKHPVTQFAEGGGDEISLGHRFCPVGRAYEQPAHLLAVKGHLVDPHMFHFWIAVIARAVREGKFDNRKVEGRNYASSFPI